MARNVWQPVANGKYPAKNPKDTLEVDGEWLTVTELLVEGRPEIECALVELPDNLRLCRLTDAPGVLVEVAETIRDALQYKLYHSNGKHVKDKFDRLVWQPDYEMPTRVKAALAWLEEQGKGA